MYKGMKENENEEVKEEVENENEEEKEEEEEEEVEEQKVPLFDPLAMQIHNVPSEDEISDKEDDDYKSYSRHALLEVQAIARKFQEIFLKRLQEKKEEEDDGVVSDDDFIQEHYMRMHCDTLVENENPILKRKATKMLQK